MILVAGLVSGGPTAGDASRAPQSDHSEEEHQDVPDKDEQQLSRAARRPGIHVGHGRRGIGASSSSYYAGSRTPWITRGPTSIPIVARARAVRRSSCACRSRRSNSNVT